MKSDKMKNPKNGMLLQPPWFVKGMRSFQKANNIQTEEHHSRD